MSPEPRASAGVRATLFVSGAVLSACVLVWARTGDQTGRIGPHLVTWSAAFAAYLAALAVASRMGPAELRAALGLAVAWRLALALAPPLVSDDVYRYVWEGRVQLAGGNPFADSDRPDSARWAALRDATWEAVNHKEYAAIYPPAWQLAARAVVWVHDSVTAMKVFLVVCELLAFVVLARLLAWRSQPGGRLLVIAWSPLALVEIAGSGHLEALGILCVCLAAWALARDRPGWSAVALAVGFQVKLLPGLVGAAWWRRFRPRHAALAGVVAAALVVPYASAGSGLVASLAAYSEKWRFNDALFTPLAWATGPRAAVPVAAALLVAVAGLLGRRRIEPARAALAATGTLLLLAPDVLPWYALWLLPWLVLTDSPGALLFTGTVGLAYLVYPAWQSGEPWHVGAGIRLLEYGPPVALEAWWRLGRRAR